jgi:hypothetical protein
MHRISIRQYLLGGAAAALLAVPLVALAAPASAVTATPPTITAVPNNLMVNTFTTLTGKNFAPHKSITLKECSVTNWVVEVANPCDTTNAVTLTTDAKGGFRTGFQAQLCPNGKRVGPTAVRCFIGVPKPSGVDTIKLVGAVRIIVTFP